MKSMNLFGNNTPKEDIKPKKKEYSKETTKTKKERVFKRV